MQAYVVGGAVRDALLGLPVVDRDWVVVGATPEQMVALGYTPVGRDFPVFLHPQTHEEYALARTERKSGRGYRGFTVYSAPDVTLEADLKRRDLTINAMARDPDGRLIDPFGGERDLRDGVLRHVSDSFEEDPVRILRVARFAARFRFRVAEDTLTLMRRMAHAGEVDHLVAERVWQEFSRGLCEAHPGEMIRVLMSSEALPHLTPELDALFNGPAAGRAHEALERGAAAGVPLQVRFAALAWCMEAGDTVAAMEALCERWRAPLEVRDLALHACRWHAGLRAARDATPEALLAVLKGTDALRRPARFEELLAAGLLVEPGIDASLQRMRRALAAASAVDAGAIARGKTSGPQIAAAVDAARLAAISNA